MNYTRQRHFFSRLAEDGSKFFNENNLKRNTMLLRHKVTHTAFRPKSVCSNPVTFRDRSTYKKGQAVSEISSITDLTEEIYKSTVYVDDDIVALNKPAGISVHGSKSESALSRGATIIDTLPKLRTRLQIPELELGLSLKSFYSGLVLLCSGPNSLRKLEHVLRESTAKKSQFLSYLVISVGQPTCSLATDLTAYVSREFIHNREMSLIEEKSNNSARKAGTMMLTCFNLQKLMANDDLGVALVEISINRDRWEAVEAMMSYSLSPVLGDNLYSSRTQYVMGVPFRASAHAVQPAPQRLPEALKQALEDYEPSWRRDRGSMPLYMHRHKIELSGFSTAKSSQPLIIKAPPPTHFVSLLKHLGIYTDSVFAS